MKTNFLSAFLIIVLVLIIGGIIYAAAYPLFGYKAPVTANAPVVATTTPAAPSETASNVTLLPPTTVVMKLNSKTTVYDTVFEPTAVVQDNRCPSSVVCIQAGKAVVAVNVTSNVSTSTSGVGTAGTQTVSAQFETGTIYENESLRVTLVKVDPYPVKGGDIAAANYRFTFSIQSLKPVASNTASSTPVKNTPSKPVTSAPKPSAPVASNKCYVGGCSSQLCTDQPDVISTCEYSASYGCYKTATCGRQANGQCGWTQTPALEACIANAR